MNATQLVVGTSRRSRCGHACLTRTGARTVQESGGIDVHMVTPILRPAGPPGLPRERHIASWLAAVPR